MSLTFDLNWTYSKEVVNIPEYGDLELELSFVEATALSASIPDEIAKRCKEGSFKSIDKMWIELCISTATDIEKEEVSKLPIGAFCYLGSCAIRMFSHEETESYYNFIGEEKEETSLMEQGSWQAKDD